MANKYNAFISYRHAPEDIKIASEVQKQLERFKIPDEIQKKTGIKRFERVFRDKEELPITSDLNDDIDEAIENSDNLIVICSTRTGESIWVRKEIETFLKYHPRRNIFTVLVDGEPEDVIPDILLHDTVTVTNPDGTTEVKEELIEPLSCDYRLGIKKARKVELPRLAASLLGCSYDELIQRRRQYIRRRNTIIGTVSTCAGLSIIAYLIWSLLQIRMNYDLAQQNYEMAQSNLALAQANYETAQANYMEALNNQSEFLATVSGQYLDAHDRVTAVQLALAALPSEGNERPVNTRAEYALTTALGCYLSPGAYAMEPVWMYSTEYEIVKYMITQDQTKLIALDAYGDITVWNVEDHSVYRVIPRAGSETLDFAINREGILVIDYQDELVAYDDSYENVIWSMEMDSDHYSYRSLRSLWTISDGTEVLHNGGTRPVVLNILTGEVELELDMHVIFNGQDAMTTLPTGASDIAASPDGRLIAFSIGEYNAEKTLWVYDRDASTLSRMSETAWYIYDMRFTPDGELLINYQAEKSEQDGFVMGSTEILVRAVRRVSKFDVHSGKEAWGEDIPYTFSSGITKLLLFDYDVSGEKIPAVGVFFSNKVTILTLDTGKELFSSELSGEHVSTYLTGAENALLIIMKTGKFMYIPLSSDDAILASYDYFLDGITDTATCYFEEEGDTHYLIKYGDQGGVIEYKFNFYDSSYTGIEGLEKGEVIRESLLSGDKVLMFGNEMNLYCFDAAAGSMDWKITVPGDSYTNVRLLCTESDGTLYLINRNAISGDDRGDKMFAVNISDGSMSPVEGVPYGSTIIESCVEDKIVMAASYSDELAAGIYVYDCLSHTVRNVELTGDIPASFGTGSLSASPDGSKAVYIPSSFVEKEPVAYLIDLETGSSVRNSCAENSFSAWDKDSEKFAIGSAYYADVYDASGNLLVTVPKGDSDIVSVAFCDKGLITYSQFNTLLLYDLEGNMIGNIQLVGRANPSHEQISYEFLDDELLVRFDVYSSLIDLNDYEIRTSVFGLFSYDHSRKRFYVKTFLDYDDIPSFGYYERLSVDEMIEMGNEYLGGAQLSDEIKNLYGIS